MSTFTEQNRLMRKALRVVDAREFAREFIKPLDETRYNLLLERLAQEYADVVFQLSACFAESTTASFEKE